MGCCLLLIVLTNEGGRKEVIGLFVYSGCGLRDAGYAMRVTGCAMWVTGLGHRDPRCGSRDAGYWVACVSVKISRSGSSVHAAIAARNVRNFSSRAAYSRFQIPRFQIITPSSNPQTLPTQTLQKNTQKKVCISIWTPLIL